MKFAELANKNILIIGRGIEGKATYKFLKRAVPSARLTVVDKQDGPHYLDGQSGYDLAIKSPGIPPQFVTIPHTTPTNIFFANTTGRVIGVTGTKGKSTTASLIFAILKQANYSVKLVGNIGTPAISELAKEKKDTWYVYELSSYQLQDIHYSPHISVIINLYSEHMNYHGSMESYWEAKKRIAAYATASDYFVYNPSFPLLVDLAKKTDASSVPFVDTLPFSMRTIPLLGTHNIDNVRAAVTVGQILSITPKDMRQALIHFKPLPHRLQNIGTFYGITFYDDAISTIPESTIAAIDAIGRVGTIFLGGQDRGYDFAPLVRVIDSKKIQNVVLFPDSGEAIGTLLKKLPTPPRMLTTRSMQEAVSFAYDHTPKGSVCLLSCASPSYSLWKNFEEKGDEFQHYVRRFGSSQK